MIPLLVAWPLACAGAVVVWARIAARLNRTPSSCTCWDCDDYPDTWVDDGLDLPEVPDYIPTWVEEQQA